MLSYYLQQMYHWLLPFSCLACGRGSNHFGMCRACHEELPWLHHACKRCANPLADDAMIATFCGECLKQSPPYHSTIALFYYHLPVDYLITALKFGNKLSYARFLGQLLANKVTAHYSTQAKPELIIPVPLHSKRLRERGYNQAIELARPITKQLGVPLSLTACTRITETAPQSSIPAAQRKQNIKNAFIVNLPFKARHVAIVDDVVTTGSTVAELARALRKQGVAKIDVWCCAKTLLKGV